MEFIIGFLTVLVVIVVILFFTSLNVSLSLIRPLKFSYYLNEHNQKLEAKESLDQFTHKHSEHWEHVRDITPWRIRLRLSRFRGKEHALTWRIKLLAFFTGMGPQAAQWLLEEYMITAKVKAPAPVNSWVCPKCGTNNADTALFCKDCGEYK